VRWGQLFNCLGTRGCSLRELSLGYLCENIAKPALGTVAALNSAVAIGPVNTLVGTPPVMAMVHRGRRFDLISDLLRRDTECTFKAADDAANCATDNHTNGFGMLLPTEAPWAMPAAAPQAMTPSSSENKKTPAAGAGVRMPEV